MDSYPKAKEAAKAVPQDVDVNALIAYKQKKEQERRGKGGQKETNMLPTTDKRDQVCALSLDELGKE